MAQKQPLKFNFSGGLDTKDDSKQVPTGRFLSLVNSVFTTGGRLSKRNGNQLLTALPDTSSTYLTTLNGNLTAIGTSVSAYSQGSMTWVSKGQIQPLTLSTLPLIRNSLNQSQADTAISPNNLVCTVYIEFNSNVATYKYAIADATSGQNISAPRLIPTGSGSVTGAPRVFLLGNLFIIVYTVQVSGAFNLMYRTIGLQTPTVLSSEQTLAASYTPSANLDWDGVVVNTNTLYFAYNTLSGGQAVKAASLTSFLAAGGFPPTAAVTFAGSIATIMSACADMTNPSSPIIYFAFYDSNSSTGHVLAVDRNLNTVLAPTQWLASGSVGNVTAFAQSGSITIFYENINSYSYDSSIPTNFIDKIAVTQSGSVGSPSVVLRSVGLASKAFAVNGIVFFLAAYQSAYQPTYFLINGTASTSVMPVIAAKIAYGNGGGYLPTGLPNVSVVNNVVRIAYLFKDLVAAVNKDTNVAAGTQVNGVYSQTGVNLVTFNIGTENIYTTEIANDLHISAGYLAMYDSYLPVEHNFFVWPDNVEATWSSIGGSIAAQPDSATNTNAYFYQVTYEWADNQGNVFRSAPSIPVSVTTIGTGSTGAITINVPTLRLTSKTSNPAKIVIYRWSVKNQTYYQVTSITAPVLNDTTIDSVSFVDTLSDAEILGNNIIYTDGGVVEDVNAPATTIMTLFDTRLWLVDAEDPNLLWFSKQVIEATPVEMSDLLTFFVPPTTAAQGSTGPMTALAPMDDKLIIFKQNAIYYVNGIGPDNTGANSQYSQPIFVTSTVGCSNQQSIVFMPQGLMFQSDKGIWLLGRDLSTQYVGAAVEAFNTSRVQSAVNVPKTNQVRFTLNTGEVLMYDYYYQQWGTFEGIPGISSCVYQNLNTFLNKYGQVYQENPGSYLDGSAPVLLSFTTSWLNLAGNQGYQRLYEFQLLGDYFSPHKLQIDVAYDFQNPTQRSVISPLNFSGPYGSDALYGQGSPYGGPGNLEQWRIFANHQKCQAFQITLAEVFDPSFGTIAGEGFNLSGINCVIGVKRGYRPIKGANSVG